MMITIGRVIIKRILIMIALIDGKIKAKVMMEGWRTGREETAPKARNKEEKPVKEMDIREGRNQRKWMIERGKKTFGGRRE